MPNLGGWIRDDQAVADVQQMLGPQAFGDSLMVEGESLTGYGERQIARGQVGVFPHLAELNFQKDFSAPWRQRGPICVGCGTETALYLSWTHKLVRKGQYGRPVRIALAPIYAGSRNDPRCGNGRLGNRGGSNGAWAAYWVHDRGVVEAQRIGGYDMSTRSADNDLAMAWSQKKPPKVVVDAGSDIKVTAHFCRTAERAFDAAMAGFGLTFCHDLTFGPKNRDGISRLTEPANHCTALAGAAVTKSGGRLIGGFQSSGPGSPSGPSVLKHAGGTVAMRAGMCFVPLEDFDKAIRNGAEIWAFDVVTGWR